MDDFAEKLASATPTPGGGAAAARVGVYACSLIQMVTGITLKKISEGKAPASEGVPEIERAQESARRLGKKFSELEQEDMAAFQSYLDALRLPRSSEEEKARRLQARQEAAWRATRAPLDTLRGALETLRLCQRLLDLARTTPLKAESDLGAAVELTRAVFRVAQLNVRANLPELDESHQKSATRDWQSLVGEIETCYAKCSVQLNVTP